MKDCILAIFWPRKDIYKFFKDHGCTTSDLHQVKEFEEDNISRSAIVDIVFDVLETRADNGLGRFRAMLQALITWDQFDPYYFERLGKLDRQAADRTIEHLRQLTEIRDEKNRKDRAEREAREREAQNPRNALPVLLKDFLSLHSGSLPPLKRGYALETILAELGRIESLEVSTPFRVNGEQIDGAVKFDGEHYLVEAKWQEVSSANEPVYQFVGKIEGKMYGRGLFMSVNGFSENVVKSIVVGKAIKTVFVDGEDLVLVLEEQLSFREMIDAKVRAAQTKGLVYVHPITGKPKC